MYYTKPKLNAKRVIQIENLPEPFRAAAYEYQKYVYTQAKAHGVTAENNNWAENNHGNTWRDIAGAGDPYLNRPQWVRDIVQPVATDITPAWFALAGYMAYHKITLNVLNDALWQ